jgi:hypothetical protein
MAMAILQDLYSQIEQERVKRIKLEEQIEILTMTRHQRHEQEKCQQQQQEQRKEEGSQSRRSSSSHLNNNNHPSKQQQQVVALQTQVNGTRQIVEALTEERPAIAAAARQQQPCTTSTSSTLLPLALVRLLELVPWHPDAQDKIKTRDVVYEWQCYDPRHNIWRSDLPSFPDFFHALPVVGDCDHHDDDHHGGVDHRKKKGGDGEGVVLTNFNLTQRYHALTLTDKERYSPLLLPNPKVSGTWKWIGRWTIDNQPVVSRDENGTRTQNNHNPTNPDTCQATNRINNRLQVIRQFLHLKSPESSPHGSSATTTTAVVDTPTILNRKGNIMMCDADGWIYGRKAAHCVLWNVHQLCWNGVEDDDRNNPSDACDPQSCLGRHKKLVLRRRKWTRQRVLVDYPFACKATQEYLRIHADNSSLALATQELAEQLQHESKVMERVHEHYEAYRKTNQAQLHRFQCQYEKQEEVVKKLRYGKFKRKIAELSCTKEDILPLLANPDLFHQLQRALRQSGAVTNAMLQQGIHFYIQDHVRGHYP